MSDISKASVPVIVIGAAIPFMVGGILWLSSIYSLASEAQKINEKQDMRIETQMDLLLEIRDRLIRIEEKQKHGGN